MIDTLKMKRIIYIITENISNDISVPATFNKKQNQNLHLL